MKARSLASILGVVALLVATGSAAARPLADPIGTAFTYQGRLNDGGSPANGDYDFEFRLWDAEAVATGTLIGAVTKGDVAVADGLFTVQLDFGAVFDGAALWLEIAVREGSEVGDYTTLSPRQPLTPTPYALYSASAPWGGLTGVPAGFADGVDDGTTYTAGMGLTLSANELSVDSSVIQKRVGSSCSTGNAIRGIDVEGNVICETVVSGGGTVTQIVTGAGLTGGPITTSGTISLAFGGVTSDMIAADTITASDIASGAVNTSEILNNGISLIDLGMSCAAGQVIKSDGATAWACAADDDTNTTYTAGDGLELDGTQFKGKGTAYQNVVIVAQSGGDFTSIQAALDSITDASNTNHYLIYVAPGVYSEQVTMKPYVDIEGAGELTTKVTYTGSVANTTGTLLGADNAEVRFLAVENTGGASYAFAIYNGGTSPHLTHVTATAWGASNNRGVFNDLASSATMTSVTASVSGGGNGYGVYNYNSWPTMTNVTASSSGATFNHGVFNDESSPTMTNVTASASGGTNSYGVYNYYSAPTMTNVSASGSGENFSVGVFNGYSSATMTNVIAIASTSGGDTTYGVYNSTSSPVMNDVTAIASGGTNSHGVYNLSSTPTMTNVAASGSGATYNHGVFNSYSAPVMNDVTASASGGTSSYGMYNTATIAAYVVLVNNSQISGTTNSIYTNGTVSTGIGASLLSGGPVSVVSGTVTCAGVYDENYTFYASTCP